MRMRKWLSLALALLMALTVGGGAQAANRYSLTREEMEAITNPVDALRDSEASYEEWYAAARQAREALRSANQGPRNYGDQAGAFTKALNRTFSWGGFAEGTYLLPQYLLGSGPSWVVGSGSGSVALSNEEESIISSMVMVRMDTTDDEGKAISDLYIDLLRSYFLKAPHVTVTMELVRDFVDTFERLEIADTAEKREAIQNELDGKASADPDALFSFDASNLVKTIDAMRTTTPAKASSEEERRVGNFTQEEQEYLDRFEGKDRLYLELYLMNNPDEPITNVMLEALIAAYRFSDAYKTDTEATLLDKREAVRAANEAQDEEPSEQTQLSEDDWAQMLAQFIADNPGLNIFAEDAEGIRNAVYGVAYDGGPTNTELMHINHQIIIGALAYAGYIAGDYAGVVLGVDADGNAVIRLIPKGAQNVSVGTDEYAIIWGEVNRVTITGNGIVQTAAGADIHKVEVNGKGSLEANGGHIDQVSLWYDGSMRVYDTTSVGKIFVGGNATLQYPTAEAAKGTIIYSKAPGNVSALDGLAIDVVSNFYVVKGAPVVETEPTGIGQVGSTKKSGTEETTKPVCNGTGCTCACNASGSTDPCTCSVDCPCNCGAPPATTCTDPSCYCACNPMASVPSPCICINCSCGHAYTPPTTP